MAPGGVSTRAPEGVGTRSLGKMQNVLIRQTKRKICRFNKPNTQFSYLTSKAQNVHIRQAQRNIFMFDKQNAQSSYSTSETQHFQFVRRKFRKCRFNSRTLRSPACFTTSFPDPLLCSIRCVYKRSRDPTNLIAIQQTDPGISAKTRPLSYGFAWTSSCKFTLCNRGIT